ncbi:hypothetical protein KSP40_PGU018605 [Platanthera guangdongensis]|uniref:Uncharacterized protein n=1 Tax=Platanthera guangdongensis TaxID=2320717 RepID=A0ABR2MAL1_9ASPA
MFVQFSVVVVLAHHKKDGSRSEVIPDRTQNLQVISTELSGQRSLKSKLRRPRAELRPLFIWFDIFTPVAGANAARRAERAEKQTADPTFAAFAPATRRNSPASPPLPASPPSSPRPPFQPNQEKPLTDCRSSVHLPKNQREENLNSRSFDSLPLCHPFAQKFGANRVSTSASGRVRRSRFQVHLVRHIHAGGGSKRCPQGEKGGKTNGWPDVCSVCVRSKEKQPRLPSIFSLTSLPLVRDLPFHPSGVNATVMPNEALVQIVRRDNRLKEDVPMKNLVEHVRDLLSDIHKTMFNVAKEKRDACIKIVYTWEEFMTALNEKKLILASWLGLLKVTDIVLRSSARCITTCKRSTVSGVPERIGEQNPGSSFSRFARYRSFPARVSSLSIHLQHRVWIDESHFSEITSGSSSLCSDSSRRGKGVTGVKRISDGEGYPLVPTAKDFHPNSSSSPLFHWSRRRRISTGHDVHPVHLPDSVITRRLRLAALAPLFRLFRPQIERD